MASLPLGFRRTVRAKDYSAPSQDCPASQYHRTHCGPGAIIDGRRTSIAVNPLPPPLEIFHPAFATFKRLSPERNLSVPEDFVRTTAKLVHAGSHIFPDVWEPEDGICRLLSALLGFSLQQPSDKTVKRKRPGYFIPSAVPPPFSGTASLATIELGTESGTGALRSTSAHIAHWCEVEQKASLSIQAITILNSCFTPSFVIGVDGPHISISGIMITGKPIVQHLRDIWLSQDHHRDGEVLLENARVLYALKLALERLHTFYTDLPLPTTDAYRFFPLATRYSAPDGRPVNLTYIDVLKKPGESSTVFLARLDVPEPRHVVVKFAERYGVRAHELLAEAGLAPALLYHGAVWPGEDYHGHEMVVMEHVEGVPAFEPEWQSAAAPEVERAMKILYDNGMVHGDLRPPNILLLHGWEQGVEGRVRIIDFDWAGREGEVRYPGRLSKQVFPVDGIDDHSPITYAHDKGMLSLLRRGAHRP
ncbi:uncharacterized protein BXZ73DRAFT_60923 [Epithele typhae]|uniref:uncharacterized protein n=1 Tax=Epithele typhae TaxID=378194 RepID=UPI00200844BC|nr:uncharacterized protein BXZ73DRAFT_60923 [Epithele typhae]KAH9906584.1 hypothetical protein BXZ73DRAFT_60923 [Epithele typhae]